MVTTTAPNIRETQRTERREEQGHASFLDFAGVAIDSLRGNKLRSFLTLLGITIGITSIISVSALIQGMDRYWKTKISNFGPNTFVVTQFPITTNLDRFFEMIRRNPEVHADAAASILRYCNACDAVGVETRKQVAVRYGRQSLEQVDMSGITPNIPDIEGYGIEVGRGLQEWDEEHSRFVTFIGWEVAEKLFASIDPLGKNIQIGDHWYTIVGVAEKKGTVLGFSRDNFAKIPLSTFQKIYGSRRTVNISIRAREAQMQQAQDQSRLVMRTLHHLGYHEDDDFGLISSEGVNQLFDQLTSTIFAVSIFVVGISLVVGGIVIMNIMLVSVVERTKEIGIRKAVGARQQDVVNQFLVESVILCCAGGAGGIVFAWCISWALAHLTPLPSSFPLWAPLVALTLSTIIGLFFGIYPARRAGRLDPIEALRSE